MPKQTLKGKSDAYIAGVDAWEVMYKEANYTGTFEFPQTNPYGDEYGNTPAKEFRAGFKAAARNDGYTYSRMTGEYCEGGELENDDFPEPADVEELL